MMREGSPDDSFWSRYGWLLAAVWIVFLFFPISILADSGLPVAMQVVGYALIALFAAVYLFCFHRFSSDLGVHVGGLGQARIPFAVLLLTVAATVPILGRDAVSFGPFIISYAAYLLSVRSMWITNATVLAITLAVAVPGNMIGNYMFLLGLIAVLIIVNAVNTGLIRHSISADKLRIDYALLESQERMARDVHDVLGHSLTALSLKADLAERLLDTDIEKSRKELQQIRTLTAEALDSIRATVDGLRRTTLDEELRSVRETLADAGIKAVVVGNAESLETIRSQALSWVLRESATNVLRHAHAEACWIIITGNTLSIEDDGDSLAGSSEGHGIRGMRERARLAGAVLSLGVSEHGGTKVAVQWN